jgi:RNA polymerase sigma-70 factor (ECF subfamily)
LSDAALLLGLRDRDPAAYQRICDVHLPSVWRYVFACVHGDQHLAEDIVSETMLALLDSAEKLDHQECNLGGWLRVVARNKIRDHLRAVARVQHLIAQTRQNGHANQSAELPPNAVERIERSELVRRVMNDMADQQRLALEWKYIERLSVRDIADRFAISIKATESLLFRSRSEFRKQFERAQQPPFPTQLATTESKTKERTGSTLPSTARAASET